jgi:diaminohydroxyphosphoribosylaminopyrimidine deaminase/5-amino-6-(5-phosphoribosylamino)uracil reductase
MSAFSPADCDFMAQAIRLAQRGIYSCHPNPRVGCVLVKDGNVIGRGWHIKAGEGHAEINALADAGDNAHGATAYVSLEPCSHHGKTPPCVDALVDAGIVEVVAAGDDPNPKVAGAGFAALRDAGIKVRSGLLQNVAEKLNEGFFSRIKQARPFVRLKVASSLDGRTAMSSGESQWITGEAARADVQRLRAASGAVMVGAATVLADDPALTVRDAQIENEGLQPHRVIVDSHLRTPPGSRMFKEQGDTTIFCVSDDNRAALEAAGSKVIVVPAKDGKTDLSAVLKILAEQRINDLLVEAGPVLAGSLLDAGLVDELVIYQAPHIMGSNTRGMFSTPEWSELGQRMPLNVVDTRQVGEDMRITARPGR